LQTVTGCQREFATLAHRQTIHELERDRPNDIGTFQDDPGARDVHETRCLTLFEAARIAIQQHDAVFIVEAAVPFLRRCQIDRLKRGHGTCSSAPSSPRDFRAERTRSFTL
jgi:hypothetical protein